jgi:hypothetical protein
MNNLFVAILDFPVRIEYSVLVVYENTLNIIDLFKMRDTVFLVNFRARFSHNF